MSSRKPYPEAPKLAIAGGVVQGAVVGGLAGSGLAIVSPLLIGITESEARKYAEVFPPILAIATIAGAAAGAWGAWTKREAERKASASPEQSPAR
jgi:undecaprenyl pyrophosphate phosphatase UppP